MKDNGRHEVFRNLSLILQVGLTVLVPFVGLLFLGVFLDRRFGTKFWTVLLMLLGLSGGLSGAWGLLRASYRKEDPVKEEYDLMEGFHPENRAEKTAESGAEKTEAKERSHEK